jgi:hypothetical protein
LNSEFQGNQSSLAEEEEDRIHAGARETQIPERRRATIVDTLVPLLGKLTFILRRSQDKSAWRPANASPL